MWRQKSEDQPSPSQLLAPDPVRPVLTRHNEVAPPAKVVAPNANPGFITTGITVRGAISGTDDLCVEGTVEGSIDIPGERVTVGREGCVVASKGIGSAPCIRAREIVILGSVRGNIEAADRVEMRAQASLTGDVSTHRVSIEEGAYFRGGIDIRRDEAPAQPPMAVPVEEPVHA